MTIFHLSKLWKDKFSILWCTNTVLLVRLQRKFDIMSQLTEPVNKDRSNTPILLVYLREKDMTLGTVMKCFILNKCSRLTQWKIWLKCLPTECQGYAVERHFVCTTICFILHYICVWKPWHCLHLLHETGQKRKHAWEGHQRSPSLASIIRWVFTCDSESPGAEIQNTNLIILYKSKNFTEQNREVLGRKKSLSHFTKFRLRRFAHLHNIMCSWANRRERNFAKRPRTTPEATKWVTYFIVNSYN